MSTGVILVTHGQAGSAMLDAAQKVLGGFQQVRAIGVELSDDAGTVKDKIDSVVHELQVEEVLFLVDLSGSTPFNLCCRSCGGKSVVLTGLNMPMLFKLATCDGAFTARELADELAETGHKSITLVPGTGDAS